MGKGTPGWLKTQKASKKNSTMVLLFPELRIFKPISGFFGGFLAQLVVFEQLGLAMLLSALVSLFPCVVVLLPA